jgi:hypothetical protein
MAAMRLFSDGAEKEKWVGIGISNAPFSRILNVSDDRQPVKRARKL